MLFDVGDLSYGRIKVWTPTRGSKDLISYGNDISHNAADIGTDGVDMVWVEGIGRDAGSSGLFGTYDLMASAFATEAANVQKRRVRSADPDGWGSSLAWSDAISLFASR